MIKIAPGVTAKDIRLGRVARFDDRSRSFPIRALLDRKAEPRSYTWRLSTVLDQGQTPMCVGFSIAHELAARPVVVPADVTLAVTLYNAAQRNDQWPGEGYEGSSVLGGMTAAKAMGYYSEFRWSFSLDDLVLAVGHHGPAVLGMNWYSSMLAPSIDGTVHISGEVAGGHAILCNRVDIRHRRFFLSNSWGVSWGLNGGCWISFEDVDRLLHEDGEAAIPVTRLHH